MEKPAETITEIIMAKEWLYPIRPKKGYRTTPDFDTAILKMSKEELSAVEEFQIENEFGSINFIEPVDLVDVNLERDVVIRRKNVEVYPEEENKPTIG